jgi:hypothetical protein
MMLDLSDTVTALNSSFIESMRASLAAITDSEWFKAFRETIDELDRESHLIKPTLLAAGFWITPSISYPLLLRIRERYAAGDLTTAALQSIFVETYRADDCRALRGMVQKWQRNPLFAARMPIFVDALQAHCDGKYTLSIPALLPQIESIASALTGVAPGKTFKAVTTATKQINGSFLPAITSEVLLAYITTMAYADTREPAYAAELARHGVQPNQVLQRHAILHGLVVDYANEENSLRAFLLLDALSYIPVPVGVL